MRNENAMRNESVMRNAAIMVVGPALVLPEFHAINWQISNNA